MLLEQRAYKCAGIRRSPVMDYQQLWAGQSFLHVNHPYGTETRTAKNFELLRRVRMLTAVMVHH